MHGPRQPNHPCNNQQAERFGDSKATIGQPAQGAPEQHECGQSQHFDGQPPPQPGERGGRKRTKKLIPRSGIAIRGPLQIGEMQRRHRLARADGGHFVDFFKHHAMQNQGLGIGAVVALCFFENQYPGVVIDTKRLFGPRRSREFDAKQAWR